MKQLLQYPHRNGLVLEECPLPACKRGGVVVQNKISLISPGTEKALIDLASKSLVGKARSRPDLVRQVLEKIKVEGLIPTLNKVKTRLKMPVPLGYSSAGVIQEIGTGVADFRTGDRVACAGFGYACHADQIFVPANLVVPLPGNLSFEQGAFATLGAIALWGVRQSDCRIGERIAVIGMGVLGQLTLQILKAAGCQVIAIDIDPDRLSQSETFSPDITINSADPNATTAIRHFTAGVGVDTAIITAATSTNQPIELAAEICRDRGRVTVVGSVRMELPRRKFYQKELTLSLSRSYGPGRYDPIYEERGIDYPLPHVRWTERRNMESFLELVAAGRVTVEPLVSRQFPIEQAAQAFEYLESENPLGILLKYSTDQTPLSHQAISRKKRIGKKQLNVGFLGAGGFATGVLLPALRRNKKLNLHKLYSATPYRSKVAATMFAFESVAQSENEIYSDPDIDTVFIATPHYLHTDQVITALEAGKPVFVEKPLCLDFEQLRRIKAAWRKSKGHLMVGFNRRYSIVTEKIRMMLANRQNPVIINYMVNAGFIPKESWLQDDTLGGGRIIGEVCHFIDLICHLTSSKVRKIRTNSISGQKDQFRVDDNIVIHLQMDDGSSGTITYTSLGDKKFPKEMMTLFADQSVLQMSNFNALDLYRDCRHTKLYRGGMDKGFVRELEFFAEQAVRVQSEEDVQTYFHSTETSLLALESLKTGREIALSELNYDE